MYNIFVLGAGFSKPAGLPLCDELFKEILRKSKKTDIYQNILKKEKELFFYSFMITLPVIASTSSEPALFLVLAS